MASSTPQSGSLSLPAPDVSWGDRASSLPGSILRTIRRYPFPAACAIVLLTIGIAVGLADILPLADPNRATPIDRLQSPTWSPPFGTDGLGHRRILRDEEVVKALIEFIAQ